MLLCWSSCLEIATGRIWTIIRPAHGNQFTSSYHHSIKNVPVRLKSQLLISLLIGLWWKMDKGWNLSSEKPPSWDDQLQEKGLLETNQLRFPYKYVILVIKSWVRDQDHPFSCGYNNLSPLERTNGFLGSYKHSEVERRGSAGRARTQIPQNLIKAKITNRAFVLWGWADDHTVALMSKVPRGMLCQTTDLDSWRGPPLKAPCGCIVSNTICKSISSFPHGPWGIPIGALRERDGTSLLGQPLLGLGAYLPLEGRAGAQGWSKGGREECGKLMTLVKGQAWISPLQLFSYLTSMSLSFLICKMKRS